LTVNEIWKHWLTPVSVFGGGVGANGRCLHGEY